MKETMIEIEIAELIREVHRTREASAETSAIVAIARARWEEENAQPLQLEAELRQQVADLEAELREAALCAYDGRNKQPAPGVGIREMTKVEYDERDAFAWAQEHKLALKLDRSAFDRLAKKANAYDMGFVRVYTELQATIARDLTDALAELDA